MRASLTLASSSPSRSIARATAGDAKCTSSKRDSRTVSQPEPSSRCASTAAMLMTEAHAARFAIGSSGACACDAACCAVSQNLVPWPFFPPPPPKDPTLLALRAISQPAIDRRLFLRAWKVFWRKRERKRAPNGVYVLSSCTLSATM